MARTKGKPGPKPKYGQREEIHVLIPIDDLQYIRSMTDNVTEWVIQAIQEKRTLHEAKAKIAKYYETMQEHRGVEPIPDEGQRKRPLSETFEL